MTQGDLGKWANLQGCQNLLFFSQLVNELLFDYSIPSNRISTLNSHYLCLDALSAIEGIDEKGVPEGTLAPIVEELYTALKLDPIFIDVSPSPLDYFVKLEKTNYRISCNVSELNYIEKKNAVESVFTVFFSNGNYYRKLKNKIVEIVVSNDSSQQSDLFRLSKSLLTEIINIGYSTQYIFYIMNRYYWNPQNCINDPKQINLFFDAFSLTTKEYDVAFRVNKHRIGRFLKFIDGVDLLDKIEPRTKSHTEKQFVTPKNNDSFIIIKRHALDYYEASAKAKAMLSLNMSIFRMYNHEFRYNVDTIKCGVYDGDQFYRIKAPKSAVLHHKMPSDERIKEYMSEVEKAIIATSNNQDQEMMTTLFTSIQFHSHALDSISNENQLLDFWAIFESSLILRNTNLSDRIQQICLYLVPILKRKYLYSLFHQLANDIKLFSEPLYNSIIGDKTNSQEIVQQVCEFCFLDENKGQREVFLAKCINYPLLHERIEYYSSKLKNISDIYDFVEKHANRVRWQIMRIYRNRNLIIHNGKKMPYLTLLVENLHSYVDDFMEHLMKSAINGRTLESMFQELYIKECNWGQLRRKKHDLDKAMIKELLSY